MTKAVLWIGGVLAIVVVAIAVTRQPILEGRYAESARPLYMLIAPPADLYSSLAVSPAVLDEKAASYRFVFEHKYAGTHELGVSVEKQVPMPVQTYDWGARYRVVFYVEGKPIKTEIVGARMIAGSLCSVMKCRATSRLVSQSFVKSLHCNQDKIFTRNMAHHPFL